MKVVIIEGTDNVGKDTIINRLRDTIDDTFVYHCDKPKSETSEEQAMEQEELFAKLAGYSCYLYKKYENGLFVHNRSWYGEKVYGCIYRNNDPELVQQMIWNLEDVLNSCIDSEDICFITLLSNDIDFLVANDDGLSISNAKKELIKKETEIFEETYHLSKIKNKHLIYVNDGNKFRDRDEIFQEVLTYIGE